MYNLKNILFIVTVPLISLLFSPRASYAAALTPGDVYTVTVEAMKSDGTLTSVGGGDSLGLSATPTADANGKIDFAMQGLPTRSQYNFLVVTIQDSTPATVRQSIIPAPLEGGTIGLGVSPMTYAQTKALLSALQTVGSDDPTIVLFGGIIIRTGGFEADDITHLGNIGRLAIKGPNGDDTAGGFNWYLLNEAGITAAQLAAFQNAIVAGLANYTSLLKDSVETLDTGGDGSDERAQAAALLSQILSDAAYVADFDTSYINAAMKAASDQVEQYLGGAGATMDEAAVSAMDSVMMSNYMKLSAERVRNKYTKALTALGATQDQIDTLDAAITNLSNSLLAAFQTFEDLFNDEEALLDEGDADQLAAIEAARDAIQVSIDAAFNTFMEEAAASNDDIDNMIVAMASVPPAGFGMDLATLNDMKTNGMFKFFNADGEQNNWPITMVVAVTWVAENYGNDGLTYTRMTDGDLAIPPAMAWLDGDDATPGQQRNDFATDFGMPAGLALIFNLREDIEIINLRGQAGLVAASMDMTQAGYDALSVTDQAEADADVLAGDLEVIAVEDDIAIDDYADGALVDTFAPTNDLYPYITGEESQGIAGITMGHLTTVRNNIDVADGYTLEDEGLKDALMDTCTMPDFN